MDANMQALTSSELQAEKSTNKEAYRLWVMCIQLLDDEGYLPSVIAMLKGCAPVAYKGNKMLVYTSLSFAARKIIEHMYVVEGYLEEVSDKRIHVEVEVVPHAIMDAYMTLAKEEACQAPSSVSFESYEVPEDTVVPISSTHAVDNEDTYTPTDKLINVETRVSEQDFYAAAKKAYEPTGHRANVIMYDYAPSDRVIQTPNVPPTMQINNRHKYDYEDDVPNVAGSKLTFDRFVQGEENMFAYQAATQVACGVNSQSYNPLFIYGKSGLGKTHLLRAIQNYIITNDSERICIYKTAAEFIEEYTRGWQSIEGKHALTERYKHVDVLIIDDIQNMRTAAGTIRFFFDTFNTFISQGKQIVLAADRSPQELQLGESEFDERETSRMDSGITITIQVPNYELKLNLINNFYKYIRHDAEQEDLLVTFGEISEDQRAYMAKIAGTNIRVIEGFVQTCLMHAGKKQKNNEVFTNKDIDIIAEKKWPKQQKTISIEHIQHIIETLYDVSHEDLIGNKRNKELMEPRHICIWLVRELTDVTLADIGERFGRRSHATIKHSITWVEDKKKKDRLFFDKLGSIRQKVEE